MGVSLDRLAAVGALLRKDGPTASDVHVDTAVGCPNCSRPLRRRVCRGCGYVNLEPVKKAAAHTGAMVALFPPRGDARTLAVTGASERPEELHVTLTYLPDTPSDDSYQDLVDAVTEWASGVDAIDGTVQGLGVFNETQDGKPCTWAAVDLPQLNTARPRLIRALAANGFFPADNHSFVPHIALDYADRTADITVPTQPVQFRHVSVVSGARRTDIPLAGGKPMTVDPGAAVSVPLAKVRPSKRFSFSPVYIPNHYDAHDEWTDPDQLQEAIWGLVKSTDNITDARTLTLQHITGFNIGEWVELACWPYPHEATLTVPGEGVRKVTLPANTPWMGVLWTPSAWREVEAGRLRGLSIEGTSLRTVADIPTLAA